VITDSLVGQTGAAAALDRPDRNAGGGAAAVLRQNNDIARRRHADASAQTLAAVVRDRAGLALAASVGWSSSTATAVTRRARLHRDATHEETG
jgi:hypothetical protein